MWGMKQMPAAPAPKTKKHVINQPHTIIDKKTPGDCLASLASARAPFGQSPLAKPSARGAMTTPYAAHRPEIELSPPVLWQDGQE
jgi:hypothetical protein